MFVVAENRKSLDSLCKAAEWFAVKFAEKCRAYDDLRSVRLGMENDLLFIYTFDYAR